MEKNGFQDRVADWCGFSRAETGVLKGFTILVMIAHHLYITQIDGSPRYSEALTNLAWKGRACVLLFLFVTGYGYRFAAGKDNQPWLQSVWNRLKRFYPVFLSMLAIETLLLGCFGHLQTEQLNEYAGSCKGYLLSAAGLMNVYIDYWYIGVFLCGAMVVYPILRWAMKRGPVVEAIVFIALAILSLLICDWGGKILYKATSCFLSYETILLVQKSPWFQSISWMCAFLMGWACMAVYTRRDLLSWALLTIATLVCYLSHTWLFWPMLLCLLAAKVLSRSSEACAVLGKLGALSAVMWLNHRLIFGYWFADFFYSVPAPLNFLLLVALSALAAQVFMWVYAWVGGKLAHILASLGGRRRERGETRP